MADDWNPSVLPDEPTSYPYQPRLKQLPIDRSDTSYNRGTIPYHDFARALNDLTRRSDRVSVQDLGKTAEGRDLILITVTDPETEAETAQQKEWRQAMKTDPVGTAADQEFRDNYKRPIWFTGNIHGNEWEGADAIFNYVEYLATAPYNKVKDLLQNNRLYFLPSLNPDGRVLGQRATTLGTDQNRDSITNRNNGAAIFRDLAGRLQPLFYSDLHGYTNQLQVEPCGPPHGENYEYDLVLPHSYAAALRIEQDVVNAAIPGNPLTPAGGIKIPYRDTPSGWDDWPPIFTGQYVAFHGGVGGTVELPLGRLNPATNPANKDRAAINIAVAEQVIESTINYVHENRDDLLDNQLETYRRGVAGEPITVITQDNIDDYDQGPQQWKDEWGVEDESHMDRPMPRAYVISAGDDQRSATDVRFLVNSLITHEIQVKQATADFSLGGKDYPAGSYIVDMHQAMRGLANALLAAGSDVSQRLPTMYDVSAWSMGYLWGAVVDSYGETGVGGLDVPTQLISHASDVASMPGKGQFLKLDLAGVDDFAALNSLLDQGVAASILPDGSAAIFNDDAATYGAAVKASNDFDVAFTATDGTELSQAGVRGASNPTIGFLGSFDDVFALDDLGFTNRRTIAANASLDLSGIDVVWVSSNVNLNTSGVRAKFEEFVANGGSIVGRNTAAFNLSRDLGLVQGTVVSAPNSSNAIVKLEIPDDSVLAGHKQDYTYVDVAKWFTNLGSDTKAEMILGLADTKVDAPQPSPVMSGHWRGTATTNPEASYGQALAVSGENSAGAKAFVFGSHPSYRGHIRGGFSQMAQAIQWAAPEGQAVEAPVYTTTKVSAVGSKKLVYKGRHVIQVRVSTDLLGSKPKGKLVVRDGKKKIVTKTLKTSHNGVLAIKLPVQKPATHKITVTYEPSKNTAYRTSVNKKALTLKTLKAKATVKASAKSKATTKQRVKVTATVKAKRFHVTGKVKFKVGKKTLKVKTLKAANRGKVTYKLPKLKVGTHKVRVTIVNSKLVKSKNSKTIKIKVTKAKK